MDMNTAMIPIAGMAIPVILVPVVLGLRHAKLERELEHKERMKALELGRTLPKDEPFWSPLHISAAFGVVLPVGVFFCAWMAATDPKTVSTVPIWISAGIVGLAGVVSGAILAYRQFDNAAAGRRFENELAHKPEIDADYFDVVGTRG